MAAFASALSCCEEPVLLAATVLTAIATTVLAVGGSGSRSITRNRYKSGQVMKSAAREGD
jgi:hypothetical protein